MAGAVAHLNSGQLARAGLPQCLNNKPGALVVLDVCANLADYSWIPIAVQVVVLDLHMPSNASEQPSDHTVSRFMLEGMYDCQPAGLSGPNEGERPPSSYIATTLKSRSL